MKINNVSVSGVNVNNECDLYNKLTTKVEYVIHMKNEFSDIFLNVIATPAKKTKGEFHNLKEAVMKAVDVDDIISKVNSYLMIGTGTKYKSFVENVKLAMQNNDSDICKGYDLLESKKGIYQLALKQGMKLDAASPEDSNNKNYHECNKSKVQMLNRMRSEDYESVNLAKENISRTQDKLIKLMGLYCITRGLVAMHNRLFESNVFHGVNLMMNKDIILKDRMAAVNDVTILKEQVREIEMLMIPYEKEIILNLNLLPTFHEKSEPMQCKEDANALQLINSMLIKLFNKQDTLWTRLINAIASLLFSDLFKSKENENMQSTKNLLELRELITELRKKPGYGCVVRAKWLYGLVTQILVKGTPAQYLFDPLNVLSPDRKVWLELQKEWLKSLDSKLAESNSP
ncbi:TPA: hypothetical protein SK276_002249 [Yersinia enterocolitica]|nr:hypothetical protein [Yersinia enterocolitica]